MELKKDDILVCKKPKFGALTENKEYTVKLVRNITSSSQGVEIVNDMGDNINFTTKSPYFEQFTIKNT